MLNLVLTISLFLQKTTYPIDKAICEDSQRFASPYRTVYLHPPSTLSPGIDFPPTFTEQVLRFRSIMGRPSLLVVPHDEMKKKPCAGTVKSGHTTSRLDNNIVRGEGGGRTT